MGPLLWLAWHNRTYRRPRKCVRKYNQVKNKKDPRNNRLHMCKGKILLPITPSPYCFPLSVKRGLRQFAFDQVDYLELSAT